MELFSTLRRIRACEGEAAAQLLLESYVAQVVAAERELVRGGYDMAAMCEAFRRLIEAHAQSQGPYHQPVSADAQTALRILRGVAAALGPNVEAERPAAFGGPVRAPS